MLKIRDQAPDFALPDEKGAVRRLSDWQGRNLLVYFYPKDDTPGCAKEACGFRDNWEAFNPTAMAVVGISADTVGSHAKFSAKFHLPFPLLSDPSKETIRSYGAWGRKKFMGREYEGVLRQSFLLDAQGKIVKIYGTVDPATHAENVAEDIRRLQGKS